ncbi:zinc finger protein, putative [Bodo saltans]|uniref:Palmitoyltransferase n=1 Tax=Bodo saltans TaxID=75058 RepID=A0A0S4IXZ6_BODSA|nr:zinc finger protein, putative [Bodo saltans]|eukprot:CUG49444.1 zinc finger protein, putative [Bodo saltans]
MLIGDNKVYFIGDSGFAIVVPPQSKRCIFWNGLMLKVFFAFLLMTPQALHEGALWYVFLGMVAMNVLLSCRTVFCDPGFVPPVLREQEDDGSGVQEPNPLLEAADPAYTEDMFSLLFCRTCKHLRPKNASHCKMCDACVRDFDHHCTVLGCCIGGRNVGSFIAYLFSVAISAAYGTVLLAISTKQLEEPLTMSSPRLYLIALMFLCGVGTAVLVGCFACYYAFLVLSGKSSKQFLTASGEATFGVRKLIMSIISPPPSFLEEYRIWMLSHPATVKTSS